MPLPAGSRLGPYEILAPIGAGGMGEVYRARDSRLDRDVAIKILPPAFASDADRLMRFTREAKTLASLNHPHIAQIYGLEVAQGFSPAITALVMELVDGEDLSQRIARGPIPVGEALAIARQIAEALEAAHEQGIIHRDLKPANIKVRDDGTVKVLDFGLAKLSGPAEAGSHGSDLLNSPTMTSPAMTAMGVILGTAAYMSPEQAKGRAADRRADVWAFGVVLHEMLTGTALFAGADVTDTLVAVLSREPEPSALPADTPAAVRRLLARCLAKDRRARLDSMGAARLELDEAMAFPAAPAAAASRPTAKWMAAALLLAGVAAGAIGAPWVWGAGDPDMARGAAIVTSITATPDALSAFTYGFALSPDAATLVYAARSADGQRRLWKRRLADPRAEVIAGTEDGMYPFWSPDGRQIGFFAENLLKSVPAGGGPARTITDAPGRWPRGSWSDRDEILFSIAITGTFGIHRVAAAGGRSVPVPLEGLVWSPQWLPDGRHFLYSRLDQTNVQVLAAPVDGAGPAVTVIDHDVAAGDSVREARLSRAGFLVFNRAGVLSRQAFNAATRQVEGPVEPIGDPAGTPRAWLAVSVAGHTVAALNPPAGEIGGTPGDPVSRLVWVDRAGRVVGQLGPPGRYWTLRLSRDGQRALVNPESFAWVIDARTNLRTRMARTSGAVWMPGDREVLYRNGEKLSIMSASGEGQPRPAGGAIGRSGMIWDVSPDGRLVAVSVPRDTRSTARALSLMRLEDGDMRPLTADGVHALHASFSPDGRWIAYAGSQTGRFEIYVRPVEGDAPAIRLSADGGQHPFWRRDGAELFFQSPTDEVIAVDVRGLARTGAPGARTALFRMVTNDISADAFPSYAVMPDGMRFLVNVPAAPEPLTLIQLPRGQAAR
ncbi:MAG TPA: protein kinase [Vicinamibacterales bacterium]